LQKLVKKKKGMAVGFTSTYAISALHH